MIRHLTIFLLLSTALFASVSTKVIQNNADQLIIQVDINATSEADIQPITFIVGFPTDELPVTRIQFLNKSELSFTPLQNSEGDFDWINQQRLKNLETGTIRISPRDDSNGYYQKIIITLDFSIIDNPIRNSTKTESEFLKNRIINWETAKSWMIKEKRTSRKIATATDGQWIQFFLDKDGMASIPYTALSAVLSNISSIDYLKTWIIFDNISPIFSKVKLFSTYFFELDPIVLHKSLFSSSFKIASTKSSKLS